jgi:predicted amidohydrolase YtcJ
MIARLMSRSRREFLLELGGAAALASCAPVRRASPRLPAQPAPDLVLHHGNVITVDRSRPRAQAVALSGDRFVAVGSDDDVRALAGPRTRQVDLEGHTVLPGFIDAHSHPAIAGLLHRHQVVCDLRSIAAIQDAIRARAARIRPGEWVLGFNYDDTKTAERRFLTRQDLDAAAPRHPVLVSHRGGHSSYVNSLALERAGVRERTPDPPGGRFGRDPATGRLNGRILENAVAPFDRVIPANYTRADRRAGAALMSRLMAESGITSVHDAAGGPDDLRAYQDAHAAGELSTRVYCLIAQSHLDSMIAAGVRTGLGDDWVRIGAVKAVCDGSISERTARVSQSYVGRPDDHGILVSTEEELERIAGKAHEAGWQIGIHANGDVAIDMVLRVYERVQRRLPRRDPRFRIEHCTIIDDRLVRRIRALGAIPTPFSTYVYYHGEKMREYGAARLEHMFALRSFLDAGVRATLASDYPPGPFQPMMALQSMVTRTDMSGTTWGPHQRITAEEAIRVATLHGAYASFEERLKGSIEPGKLADLVLLGRDPLTEDPSSLITIPVLATMVGGRWVHRA